MTEEQENTDNQEVAETQATEETKQEAPTLSLGDQLKAALQEKMEQSESQESEEGGQDDAKEQEEQKQEKVAESGEDETEAQGEELPVFKAPQSWKKDDKDIFDKLPDELELEDGTVFQLKEILTKYDKSRSTDYMHKTREVAAMKKEASALQDLIEPYKRNFESMGIKPADYLQQLINLDIALDRDPKGTIRNAVEKYKLSANDLGLTATAESDDDYLTDDEKKIRTLEQKYEALEKKQQANEQNAAQRYSQATVEQSIKDFETATNDDGDPSHPHFNNNDVHEEMSIYMQRGKDMEEAYNLSPTVKRLELEKSQQVTPEQQDIKTRNNVAKAKRASLRVKNTKTIDNSGLSFKDALLAKMQTAN